MTKRILAFILVLALFLPLMVIHASAMDYPAEYEADAQYIVTYDADTSFIPVRSVRITNPGTITIPGYPQFPLPGNRMTVGAILQLRTIVTPTTATNQALTWSSSNRSVATVNQNGRVTAVGPGLTNITVRSVCGNHLDMFFIEVISTIFSTNFIATPFTWFLFIFGFGWIWMWFV